MGAPSGNGAVRCELYAAVGTSSIIYPRRGRALREAPSHEAARRRERKFNLCRNAHPEFARRAVDRRVVHARLDGVQPAGAARHRLPQLATL